MKRPPVGSEEWKRIHRQVMAELREFRKLAGGCRQCSRPAKIGRDGKPMSACQFHLDEDKARVARAASKARKAKIRG
jgi:hypothetical protein